ncbi:MAG: MobC family plasmid mobilization relaxosome protein [Brevundimonas sp.]
MDRLTVRLSPDLVRRFDAAAMGQGGRSRLLRRLIEGAAQASFPEPEKPASTRVGAKLTVRLAGEDLTLLEASAAAVGLSRTQWTVALIRRRLHGRPQLTPPDSVAFIGVQRELRRIGVNVNQIARALNTAVLEGQVLDLEILQLEAFSGEIRGHLSGLQAAFRGNFNHWSDGDG